MRVMRVRSVACVALLAFGLLGVRAAEAKSGGARLLVNDQAGVGTVGDGLLSVDEAIRLANGTLATSALSASERSQITGTPGARFADRIEVAGPTVIDVPPSPYETPGVSAIRGNTGDTLDGHGVQLSGQLPTGIGLLVASSDFTLTNVEVSGFNEAIVVDFGGQQLHNITITHVHVRPVATFGQLVVGTRSSNGSLSGLTVTDSAFEGGAVTDTTQPVVLSSTFTRAAAVSNTLLEDVLFARNDVSGGLEGFYIYGAVTNGGLVDHGLVRRVTVVDNHFHDSLDAAMNIDGGTGIVNAVSDSGVEDVTMARNQIESNGWGIGIWGGESFGASITQRNYVRRVTIADNSITGLGDTSKCIIVEAGRVDAVGVSRDNVVSDVRILRNHASNCTETGLTIFGGVSLAAGVVTGNAVHGVQVEGNSFDGGPLGLVATGASTAFGHVAQGNVVDGVSVTRNTLSATDQAVRLVGGESTGPGLTTANTLGAVTFRSNVLVAPVRCTSVVDVGSGTSGNVNNARCPI